MLRTKLIGLLADKHQQTGGHCGSTVSSIVNDLGCELQEVNDLLSSLQEKGMIELKEGVHGKLVFYNYPESYLK